MIKDIWGSSDRNTVKTQDLWRSEKTPIVLLPAFSKAKCDSITGST